MKGLFILSYNVYQEFENVFWKTILIYALIYAVFGLICGFVCRAIMRNKGYESIGWFWCGFFLGAIGLIVAACQQPRQSNYYPQQHNYGSAPPRRENGTVKCKNCGTVNSRSSVYCQSCGAKLAVQTNMITCKSCGCRNAVSSFHCQRCGATLDKNQSQNTDTGTWKCSCGINHASYETSCPTCGDRKSAPKTDWKCPCGAVNRVDELKCHRCGLEKGSKQSKAPMPLPPLAGEINTQPAQQAPVTQTETPVASIKQQLEELKEMQDQGLITEADFEAKKKQLLGI